MKAWLVLSALVVACGGDPPPAPKAPPPPAASARPAEPPPAAPEEEAADEEMPETPEAEEAAPVASAEPPPAQPPSTASFEQATATPEKLGLDDDRMHLTDNQLEAPMRGVLAKCNVPARAKVTIKAAVQFGRAIGVTVLVDMPKPKTPKKPTKKSQAAAKARAKTIARVRTCADHAVRALSWPPSRRRDSIITTF